MGWLGVATATKYSDAGGYDAYMGRWSALLAPRFLQFALAEDPASLLDVGCGTGNLLVAAGARLPEARLCGVDPSRVLLEKARYRPELGRAKLFEGLADRLPFPDRTFDSGNFIVSELAEGEKPGSNILQ